MRHKGRQSGVLVAKLSVVTPFYNVEDYLGDALESLARQTFRDLEVIMVDDGSTDSSALIAKEYAARDPRFRLIQQPNAGPGPARNAGIREAGGEYLAFFDGDDLLAPHAYERLITSLEKTGSDFAAGGCTKFNSAGLIRSWLHDRPFRKNRYRTHVSRFPLLLQDRTVWNKVFRRSFWDAHDCLAFPGGLYEDPPVAIRAHVLATRVDVVKDVIYYWRVRDTGELSTTQRSLEPGNIEQRMAAVSSVGAFLTEHAPALKTAFDCSVLRGDFALLARACEFASEPDRAKIADLAASYARSVSPAAYQAVPAYQRLVCYLLAHRMLPELLEVLRYARRNVWKDTPVVPRKGARGRWCARYPFFEDPAAGIPADIYDVTSAMTLNACLDQVSWHGTKLRLAGYAYIRRLSSASPDDCAIKLVLRNKLTRRSIELPVTRVRRPDVTARSGQGAVSYDWAGFAVEVAAARLATLPGVWRGAAWELTVQVSGGGLRRQGSTFSVRPGSAQWPQGRWVSRNVWLQPAPERDGRFMIRGQQVTAFVTRCVADGDSLLIEGWSSYPLAGGATVAARSRHGGAAVTAAAEQIALSPAAGPAGRSRRGTYGFRSRLPVRELMNDSNDSDAASPVDRLAPTRDQSSWDLYLHTGDGQVSRLAIDSASAGARIYCQAREVTAVATRYGALSLLERRARPVVTGVEWAGEHRLLLRGDYTDAATRPRSLTVRHVASGRSHTVPLSWDGCSFTAELWPGRLPSLAGPLPMASGRWQLLAATGTGQEPGTVAVARALLPALPGYRRTGIHEIELQAYQGDALRLQVRIARDESESGKYAVRQLATRYYPMAATQPIRDLAVFDSFSSRHYSDNPRAIFEELRRAHPGLECVWITADGQFPVPDGARVVPAHTREHFDVLARARYLIVNDELPRWYRRREGQTCLQTWHGTPLKRIGLDIARPRFASGLIYHEMVRRAAANWNILLSPNPFSTGIFRRAFGYEGEILEAGYPRNDALHRPGQPERAAAVRRQLGVPAGKRVILYAPTWRENPVRISGGYRFDLRLDLPAMASALQNDHVLLLRLHTNARYADGAGRADGFSFDVTGYPDITDLLLITDVLVTDYSSVMFDFAGTGRPILLYTYDLESYRDDLRGFYFDLEAEAPGPLLATTAGVIAALRDLPAVQAACQPAYERFAATYCPLDDGNASARVLDKLFSQQ